MTTNEVEIDLKMKQEESAKLREKYLEEKQLAIIRNPRIEYEDHTRGYVYMFDIRISDATSSFFWIAPSNPLFKELWEACAKTNGNVSALDGHPCWIWNKEWNNCKYLGLADL